MDHVRPGLGETPLPSLQEIVVEVDRLAPAHPIGVLQDLRKTFRGLGRKPTRNVFDWARDPSWTFHVGGRDELQFNLGIEEPVLGLDLRYGVAFSLELSQSLPTIDPLLPKIALFNDFVREHPERLGGLQMWHHADGERSPPRPPGPIEGHLVRRGTFVFLGKLGSSADPDYEDVLTTLDSLLPLWTFIEERVAGGEPPTRGEWTVKPGLPSRTRTSAMTTVERQISIERRHVALQDALHAHLVSAHGHDAVGVEQVAPGGGIADAVAKTSRGLVLFEIKTAATARGCVREALGQLLDYGCWPGVPRPVELCVVGEPALDGSTAEYIEALNARFPVPLTYRSIALPEEVRR